MLTPQRFFSNVQDELPAAEELDLSSMPVDDSYDGPTMEGDALPFHALIEMMAPLRPDVPDLPLRRCIVASSCVEERTLCNHPMSSPGRSPRYFDVCCRQRGKRLYTDARLCDSHDRAFQGAEANTQALCLPDTFTGACLLQGSQTWLEAHAPASCQEDPCLPLGCRYSQERILNPHACAG